MQAYSLKEGLGKLMLWPSSLVRAFPIPVFGMERPGSSPQEDPPSPSPSSQLVSPAPNVSESSSGISEYWQQKYRQDAAKNWNLFYRRNQTRFFKDRHWIEREFPELFASSAYIVLEVGSGVGNFALPLAEANPNLTIYACDFASTAIDLLKVRIIDLTSSSLIKLSCSIFLHLGR